VISDKTELVEVDEDEEVEEPEDAVLIMVNHTVPKLIVVTTLILLYNKSILFSTLIAYVSTLTFVPTWMKKDMYQFP
jgi:hypothetical protein